MRRIFIMAVLAALTCVSVAFATVPRTINYQGKLTDTSGNPVADGSYSLTLSIYDQESGGSPLWSGVYSADTKIGYFNLVVGGPPAGPFPVSMNFSVQYWLELKVGADPAMTPRQALQSVPYAMRAVDAISAESATTAAYATNADTLDSLNSTDFIRKSLGDVGAADVAAGAVDTQAKAPWAPRVAVGGSWRNNPIIACGQGTTDVNGNLGVGLAGYGFTAVPMVVCNPYRDPASKMSIEHYDVTTTGFNVFSFDQAGTGGATIFDWIAIGY